MKAVKFSQFRTRFCFKKTPTNYVSVESLINVVYDKKKTLL